MPRPRSGSHLLRRGEIYWYRRVVPKNYRAAFGVSEVTKSLNTTSEIEAKRLEKEHDVQFEDRLQRARDDANPDTRRARLASDLIEKFPKTPHMQQWSIAYLPPEDREPVREIVGRYQGAQAVNRDDIGRLLDGMGNMLEPLSREQIEQCRAGILSIIQHQAGAPLPASISVGLHTLEWAYSRWLRTKNDERDAGTIGMARRHFDAFVAHSKVTMLDQVRRSHLLSWRDSLSDARFAVNSINQRLNLVGAIIRTGWRDSEMAEQNLKGLALTDSDDNDRGAWQRHEILKALTLLEPHSWSAWLYLIGLTTSARMGEPMAARVNWFDPMTGMIEVLDRRYTKAKKLHCMPVLSCLREPLIRLVGNRPGDEYLLPDAPRPKNSKLRVAHETSKWFGRFFHKHKIDRVFHELRDTWIDAARHSPVERDMWEIISGHSAATMSDRYGGKKPDVLAKANETICEFLTTDAEISAAMLRLVQQ